MPDSKEAMNEFMTQEVKQSLGEAVDVDKSNDDNYDVEEKKIMNTFEGEGIQQRTDKGMLLLRRIMNYALVIPLLIVFLMFIFYLLLSVMPNFLLFLKRLLFMFF